jgi:hypothetical protein
MKEPVVHKTRSGATRQAEYAARMRADGYKQRTLWLTEEEFRQVDKLLSKLRHGDSHE